MEDPDMTHAKQKEPLPAAQQGLTFDEALTHYVGEFGKGQLRIVGAASLLGIPNGLIFLLWVMVTIDPIKNHAWRCNSAADAACAAVWAAPTSHAFCELPAGAWQWTNYNSLVSRFNLICGDGWKVQFANSLMFVGCFIGSGLFGAWSDRVGRKVPLFAASSLAAAATLVSAAGPSFWFVAAMRFVVGIGAAGQVQGVVLLCMETTGRSFRGIAGVPQVVMFCFDLAVIPMADDAGSITADSTAAAAAAPPVQPPSLGQLLWRHPSMAAMSLVMLLVWFSNFSSFYVIALGSGGLPGSIHVTFALQVTGQIIATLLSGALIDRLGRHNIISASLLIGGAACLGCSNTSNRIAQIVLATIGQFGCTASLAATPIYTAELYPTPVRSTALGMCNKACRCGSISAPFLLMLGTHTAAAFGSALFMPYVIVGCVCLLAGAAVLLMPETLGKDMPECMEDLAQLQTVFSAKPWRRSSNSSSGSSSSCTVGSRCWSVLAFLFRTRAEPKAVSAAAAAGAEAA
ncbi:hypothetical protein OEZ86_005592 [Tetradesmus obliquus]|nr:hypothetical protein OEZ86_005592 [Tetradesmus obliquus]